MTDDEQPNAWAKIVGPCYTVASIGRVLGWASEQVATAVESLELLELQTVEGVLLHPAFQIADARVIEGIGDVLCVLSTGTSSTWTWAQWLNTRLDDETGEEAPSAVEQLRAGQVEAVLLDARRTAGGVESVKI